MKDPHNANESQNDEPLDRSQLLAVLESRPKRSRTVRVSPAAADAARERIALSGDASEDMSSDERAALAAYLSTDQDALEGPMVVIPNLECTTCGRSIMFRDFIQTAVDDGVHSRDLIAEVLAGRRGHLVTVRGTTETRGVKCVSCGTTLDGTNRHYNAKHYTYA